MRARVGSIAKVAAFGSLGLLASGLLIFAIGSLVAGDFYALPLPWSGWGIDLTVTGLALTAVTLGALVIVEPLGWWRLLAVPPALATAFLWTGLSVFGLGGEGACCTQPVNPGVGILLYSSPETAAWLILSTLLIGLPLLIARLRAGVAAPRPGTATDPPALKGSP